ncbi:hypothetical protein PHYC_02300 [Phycisphaerales bacterium]|nr:hypothetical protein PHYC_02300 [Phycisphaerales bacterium]
MMKAALVLLSLVLCMLGGFAGQGQPEADRTTLRRSVEPSPAAPPAPRFEYVDVYVDCGDKPLAAWQVELKAAAGKASIVGVEGGDGVYSQAPYYDEQALQHERVIVGGLSTLAPEQLPSGRVRVARVHVMIEAEAEFGVTVMAAGLADGTRFDASGSIERGQAPGANK